MLSKQVLVKVFAGAVLVAAADAQEVVKEGEQKLVPGEVVVTSDSLAIIGRHTVGANTLHRVAARFGAQRINDVWMSVGDDGFVFYDAFGMTLPGNRYPLPLKKGMTFEYESTRGKERARVVGTEAVEVPAGKFACLAIESKREVDGQETAWTGWVAPGIGTVKEVREDSTIALARVQATAEPKPEEGAVALNTFDTPEPLRSPLFARARWGGWMGEPGRSSDVDIDPFSGGANGTPFCLRWTYTTLGTWASASISPGRRRPADLSKYKGISFYIKGLLGRPWRLMSCLRHGGATSSRTDCPFLTTMLPAGSSIRS